jgi:uncharacterized protein YqjF (DUF2071 family)
VVALLLRCSAAVDRLAPTRRPSRKAQGTQRWHQLLFSHWETDAAALKKLVHPRLTVDTFEGKAFVGVVAFTMQNVRPWSWLPGAPTATEFFEINVRTYVHLDGEEPGIVFFSLDATSSLAVLAARSMWGLPYFRSAISSTDGWRCDRRWPARPAMTGFRTSRVVPGEALPPSREGTLEFFLAERYQFYAAGSGGRLIRARVHHPPYPLHAVRGCEVSPQLAAAPGLEPGARTPDFYSPGVDVEVFSLEDVP